MNIDSIRKQLTELEILIEGWSNGCEIATIERDLALDRVKNLYEAIRFTDNTTLPETTPTTPHVNEEESHEEEDQLSDIEFEITYYEDEDEEDIEEETEAPQLIVEELLQEDAEEREPIISLELEDISIVPDEEPEPEIEVVGDLTDEEEEEIDNSPVDMKSSTILPKSSRRSAILSLYSDDVVTPAPKPEVTSTTEYIEEEEELTLETIATPEPKVDPLTIAPPTPSKIEIVDELIIEDDDEEEDYELSNPYTIAQRESTLAETLAPKVETLADRYAAKSESVTFSESVLFSSLNDRYLIAQELFGGDMSACEDMLAELGEVENFDDAMVYIVENYDWNPDCEATKLIMKYLERKFPLN